MNRRTALASAFALLLVGAPPVRSQAAAPRPEEARVRQHIETLASPEFDGRRGAGGRKAADYIVAAFRGWKLEPAFGGSYDQSIPAPDGTPGLGRNVAAVLPGSDPTLKDEWVILAAHYDHLGRRGAVLYPGADDNASGVAMMLEVARCLVESPERPRRSVMFIGFDLEEAGLFGSRYFVEHSPVPLDRVKLFITADMIGRSLGGVCTRHVFVMGTEHAPALRESIEASAKGEPVTVGLLGSDLLLLDRSDYGPFRSRKVPFLFFSTGENPKYHTPDDTPETIDYPKAAAISRVVAGVTRSAANAERLPGWTSPPDNPLAEAVTVRDVVRTLLEHREELKVNGAQALLMGNALRTLDGVVMRGAITPEERVAMVRVARIILISLF